MVRVKVFREARFDEGVFGRLQVLRSRSTPSVDEEVLFECLTVERPWANNRVRVSCIPDGWYFLRAQRFHRGGYDTYEIRDVPGRTDILIHRAAVPSEVLGCIGLGMTRVWYKSQWAIGENRKAMAGFLEAMEGVTETTIIVTSRFGGMVVDGQTAGNHD